MAKENIETNTNEEVEAKATASVTLSPGQLYAHSSKVDILTGYAKVTVKNNGGATLRAALVDPTWIDETVKIWDIAAYGSLNTKIKVPANKYYLELSNNYRAGMGSGTLSPA